MRSTISLLLALSASNRKSHEQFQRDRSGELSTEELANHLYQAGTITSEKDLAYLFKSMDSDGSGANTVRLRGIGGKGLKTPLPFTLSPLTKFRVENAYPNRIGSGAINFEEDCSHLKINILLYQSTSTYVTQLYSP